jgi:hypothetical protein
MHQKSPELEHMTPQKPTVFQQTRLEQTRHDMVRVRGRCCLPRTALLRCSAFGMHARGGSDTICLQGLERAKASATMSSHAWHDVQHPRPRLDAKAHGFEGHVLQNNDM